MERERENFLVKTINARAEEKMRTTKGLQFGRN